LAHENTIYGDRYSIVEVDGTGCSGLFSFKSRAISRWTGPYDETTMITNITLPDRLVTVTLRTNTKDLTFAYDKFSCPYDGAYSVDTGGLGMYSYDNTNGTCFFYATFDDTYIYFTMMDGIGFPSQYNLGGLPGSPLIPVYDNFRPVDCVSYSLLPSPSMTPSITSSLTFGSTPSQTSTNTPSSTSSNSFGITPTSTSNQYVSPTPINAGNKFVYLVSAGQYTSQPVTIMAILIVLPVSLLGLFFGLRTSM